jgi:hypothetical protein
MTIVRQYYYPRSAPVYKYRADPHFHTGPVNEPAFDDGAVGADPPARD